MGRTFVSIGKETSVQKEFRIKRMQSIRLLLQYGLAATCVIYAMVLVITLASSISVPAVAGSEILIARILTFVILVIMFVILDWIKIKSFYMIIMSFALVVVTIFGMFQHIYDTELPEDIITIELFYNLIMITHVSGIFFNYAVASVVVIFIPWIVIMSIYTDDIALLVGHIIYVCVFILIDVLVLYNRESHTRMITNLESVAKREIKQTDKLIETMMPKHVYENIKAERNVADVLPNVTMLFSDIAGFTSWSSDKTPVQVVEMLSSLYKQFDDLCALYNVYKVHTIGDAYIVMGYKGEADQDRDYKQECVRMIDLGLGMINVIRSVNAAKGCELNFRIGIHTGQVIAGITGTNLIRYDIYGPDTVIGEAMESGGEIWKI